MRSHRFLIAGILALAFVVTTTLVSASEGHVEPAPSAASGGHDETADPGLRSPDLAPGESWSHTFTETGKIDYHCHPHPWMLASITIIPSSGRAPITHAIDIIEPVGQDFEKWAWSPAITTIEAGDTVTWTNRGTVVHVFQETTAEHAEHIGAAGAGAEDDHSITPEAVAVDHHSSGLGLPMQGWLWVGGALLGGVFIGRQTVKKGTGANTAGLATQTLVASSGIATTSGNGSPAPKLSSHARRRDKRNRRR